MQCVTHLSSMDPTSTTVAHAVSAVAMNFNQPPPRPHLDASGTRAEFMHERRHCGLCVYEIEIQAAQLYPCKPEAEDTLEASCAASLYSRVVQGPDRPWGSCCRTNLPPPHNLCVAGEEFLKLQLGLLDLKPSCPRPEQVPLRV